MEYSTVHLLTCDNDRWDCILKRKISFAYFRAANQANHVPYLFLFTTFSLVELFSETRGVTFKSKTLFSLPWSLTHFCFLRALFALSSDFSHSFVD